MRNGFRRVACILHVLGGVLQILSVVLLLPLVVVLLHWGQCGEGPATVAAFVIPAVVSFSLGVFLRRWFERGALDAAGSMLMCSLAWLGASALGALPFVIGIGSGYLDGFFEAMSGLTTTGITVYTGLEKLPRSILFWRALTQWLGGLGILSFFLVVSGPGGKVHHVFGAEAHKIASDRLTPGLLNTVKILWGIYVFFTVVAVAVFAVEKMPIFDAVCHSLAGLSTGGFSPHDSSIGFYRAAGYANYRLIEYTVVGVMMLGGINFLVHYRVLTGQFKALWDGVEIRYWWGLVFGFTAVVTVERLMGTGGLGWWSARGWSAAGELEEAFRGSLFQVVALLTTTGFGTEDIGSGVFGALSKQLFLVMMVIGGCVGSTAGGFKVLRVAIMDRLVRRELFKLRVSGRASSCVVIDGRIVDEQEIHRVTALFSAWVVLLVIGGGVTALLSSHGPWESLSGMFSALGNIGPCYIATAEMGKLAAGVKVTYIFGMLAGRLEILPVLLLFSRKAWR